VGQGNTFNTGSFLYVADRAWSTLPGRRISGIFAAIDRRSSQNYAFGLRRMMRKG
jgi:hypothetical protein